MSDTLRGRVTTTQFPPNVAAVSPVTLSKTGANFTFGLDIAATKLAIGLFTATLSGLVPASGGGVGNFLRADGAWAAPAPSDGDKSDITVSGGGATWTIDPNVVTNAKLATIATASFKGRITAGTGNVEDLTAAQATSLLVSFAGDAGAGGARGIVPAPAAGDAVAGKFLKADGSWSVAASSITNNPGGASLTVQYNNAGVFGGFTVGGDATLDVTTGLLTVAANAITTGKINAQAVTYAKIQNVSATSRVLGRITAGAGTIEELTGANVATILGSAFLIPGSNLSDVASVLTSRVNLKAYASTRFVVSTGTLAAADMGKIIVPSGNAQTITLPAAPNAGETIIIKSEGQTGTVVQRNGAQTLNGPGFTGATSLTLSPHSFLVFEFDGGNWGAIGGDLSSLAAQTGDTNKLFYQDSGAVIQRVSLGADKTIWASNGATSAPSMRTAANLGILEMGVTANITKGYTLTPNALGNIVAGFTADPTLGNYQTGNNNGTAFTLTAPASDCAIEYFITNTAAAGAITFSGFTNSGASAGDAQPMANGNRYSIVIRRQGGISMYLIKAWQ